MAVFLCPIQGHERRNTERTHRTAQDLAQSIEHRHGELTRENKYKNAGLRAMLSPPRLPALCVAFDASSHRYWEGVNAGMREKNQ
jgi:hypothetical protein